MHLVVENKGINLTYQDTKYHILVVMRWPVGGIRTFCKYVYNNFDPDKYCFTILAPERNEIRELINDLKRFNPSFIPIRQKSNKLYKVTSLKIPVSRLLKRRFCLIHSHGISAGLFMALPAYLLKIPHILTIHETLSKEQMEGVKGKLKKILLSLLLPLINIIHHVSDDAKTNIISYITILKYFSKKNMVIHNGIEVQKFLNAQPKNFNKESDLPNNAFLIGFVGRFMPEKGFRYLIEAIEILTEEKKSIKHPIVMAFGWGAFIREYQEIINEKGLDKYFRFLPFTANVASSLKGLDVVAIPSLREAFGLVAAEAMVAGVPIIATNCIGLREVIKDSPATVIPIKDSKAIAAALLKEMQNPSKEKAKGFLKVASHRFDVKKQSKKLEKLILTLIK